MITLFCTFLSRRWTRILTNRTANKFHSHRNPWIPWLWMNADIRSQDGSWKGVSDYCMTVTVSLENLTTKNIYYCSTSKLLSSSSKIILNDPEECINWPKGQHLIAIALKLSHVPEQCQRSNRSKGKGQEVFRRARTRRAFSPLRAFRELLRPSSEFPFECLTCRLTHKSLITNHQDF